MSTQDGPSWYPSKQFTHTPDVAGMPAYTAVEPSAGAKPSAASSSRVRRFLDKLLGRSATKTSD